MKVADEFKIYLELQQTIDNEYLKVLFLFLKFAKIFYFSE